METSRSAPDRLASISSHSLGTLIEWKRNLRFTCKLVRLCRSHSLGTLIEWKLPTGMSQELFKIRRSHSLGTLIEWKPVISIGITSY